ncbi:MAG: phosphoglycerate kinase [Alphaproteobacteria bacterium]|nr:phosphoglycerate kinase [Alphaproteobacteria bacterium]
MIRSYVDVALHDVFVLVRCDVNVSFKNGEIVDNARLVQAAESLKILSGMGAKLLVLSHLGRPKGKAVLEYSLRPIVAELADLLGSPVGFLADPFDVGAHTHLAAMQPGAVILLENMRFWPEEEANDRDFAARLAALGEVFINDGFSVSHRAHASTVGIAARLPAYAGPALMREVTVLEQVLQSPNRPTVGIVGGVKISTKINIIENVIPMLDYLVIGGAMANTFLHAAGHPIGRSLNELEAESIVSHIHAEAEAQHCMLVLPKDVCVGARFDDGQNARSVGLDDCLPDEMILDVGEASIAHLKTVLKSACTVLWNGPLGAFEYPPFDRGTNEIAHFVAALTQQGDCLSVAGGGDTLAALRHAGAAQGFSYVSTAGGAFLEWLEGKTLPGIAALQF